MKRPSTRDATIETELERLVELEAEGEATERREPTRVREPVHDHATVSGVDRVAAEAVPAGYPVPITTERALRLTLESDDGDALAVYVEWPERSTADEQLARLLVELDLEPDRFGDVLGMEIGLRTMDGHYVAAIAPRPGFRSGRWYYGVLVGEFTWIVLDLWEFSDLPVGSATGTVVLLTLVAFPLAVYNDAKYVGERTDWTPQTMMWTVGAALVGVNVLVGAIYLLMRHRAVSGTY